MAHPGSFKLLNRRRAAVFDLDPAQRSARRGQLLVASLQHEILDEATTVRARRIFERPRELYRLEIANHGLGYRRTTLLDRPTLDALCDDASVGARLLRQID